MERILFVDIDYKILNKNIIRDYFKKALFIDNPKLLKIIRNDSRPYVSLDSHILYSDNNFISKVKSILRLQILRNPFFSQFDVDDMAMFYKKISNISNYLKNTNISKIVFGNIPHTPPEFLLSISAKLLDIETLSFNQIGGYLPELVTIHKNANFNEQLFRNDKLSTKPIVSELIKKYLENDFTAPFYVPRIPELKRITLIKYLFSELGFFFKPLKNLKVLILLEAFKRKIKNLISLYHYRNHFRPNNFSEIKENFIYLPLQFEPELSSAIVYNNVVISSIEIIRAAREKFDKSIQIVCKENPLQLLFNRTPYFFKLLSHLENVIYLDEGSHDYLIRNCSSLVVGRGTAGYEGIILNKPVFALSDNWYYEGLTNNLFSEKKLTQQDLINIKIPTKEKILENISSNTHSFVSQSAYLIQIKDFNIFTNTKKFISLVNLWLNSNSG